ncbi:hypothetical protein C6503_05210 [Candidatus Poribacteria bacterium]|nr:MAG: hypothetical protein C6503_05210 [Candidatus Poribacteria bacterium]
MKIKSIKLKRFRRFKDLTIEGLPEKAKLVMMIGPNGSGKSSVFDGLEFDALYSKGSAYPADILNDSPTMLAYYFRRKYPQYYIDDPEPLPEKIDIDPSEKIPMTFPDDIWDCVNIEFYHKPESGRKAHIRSAYRSYSPIQLRNILSRESYHNLRYQLRTYGPAMRSDETFASNFSLLSVCQHDKLVLEEQHPYPPIPPEYREQAEKFAELQGKIFEEFRGAIRKMFTDSGLILKYIGAPMYEGLLRFEKEGREQLSYQNLSGGEIAVLDLLLDIVIKKIIDEETIICIDEPELHIHTKLQGQLLETLYNLISPKSQLWVATHSVGMVRRAQDLWREDPDSVVFLDFGRDDFDEQVTLKPMTPDPDFWARTYEVALGDLAQLVLTEWTVFCEGEKFDADCYKNIFGSRHPEVRFISLEGRGNVEKSIEALNRVTGKIAKNAKVIGLVDGDDALPSEVEESDEIGIRTLSRRNIEGYLLDDEVLTKLCEAHGKSAKIQDLLDAKQTALKKSISEGKNHDDLKPIAQSIHTTAKTALRPSKMGNKSRNFMKNILAPLIQPGMKVYEELHEDIFGE